MFLKIRSKSVGEVVNLKLLCEDDGETYADVSINLDEVNVVWNDEHTDHIELTDDIGLMMRYPQFDLINLGSGGGETEYIFKMIKKSPSPFAVNLETKCLKNGLRLTDQRRIIVKLLEETVSDTKFHPDVDQIHQMAIKIDKKISIEL